MPPPKDPIKKEEWCRKNSEGIKKKWKDPEYRKKMMDAIARRKDDPEFQRKYVEGIKRRSEDPVWRANNKKAMRKREGNPVWREKHKLILKEISLSNMTKDPDFYRDIANLGNTPEKRISQSRFMSGKYIGDKSPLWRGGTSFGSYCPKFNDEFKRRVRAFFGYCCVECGTPENEKKHCVHHVNFNKKVCCDNFTPLFVILCPSCHGKTQSKRRYWINYFTEMINNYYEGKCYFTKEEYDSFIS